MSARDKAQKGYMRKMPKRERDKYIQGQLHTRAKIYRYMKRVPNRGQIKEYRQEQGNGEEL